MEILLKPSWQAVCTVLRRRSLKRATDKQQNGLCSSHMMKYHSSFPLTPGSRGVKMNMYSTRSVSNNIFCTTNMIKTKTQDKDHNEILKMVITRSLKPNTEPVKYPRSGVRGYLSHKPMFEKPGIQYLKP